ncbi:MAG: 4Fe-4S binding protein [Bacteroidia bacterium]|nr:4Fe-4S binding protein [Bacteroidia bacterium]
MIKLLNKLFQFPAFPNTLKILNLLILVLLILNGLTAFSDDPVILAELRNTNPANLIVWSYWWPIIIILAIFFGRIWCMICPVELITSISAKSGFRLKQPGWLQSGWGITLFYILILFIGIHGLAIHRNPGYMAIYLLMLIVVSILSGLIFEKNTFCKFLCPVGYLLGIYARLSLLGWRVKDRSVCDLCKDKSCIHKSYRYQLNAKSCGVDLYPATINSNESCILCAGCLKTCDQYRSASDKARPNPGFVKMRFAQDLLQIKPLQTAEMVFVMLVSGFVIYEIGVEWDESKRILKYVPNLINEYLGIHSPILKGIIKGTILFGVLPFSIWVLPYIMTTFARTKIGFIQYLRTYGIVFIPLMAAAHLDKAIIKMTSRITYFEHLGLDLSGVRTAKMILSREIVLSPLPMFAEIFLSFLLIAIIAGGIWLGIILVRKLNRKSLSSKPSKIFYLIPILYGSIFLSMILLWRL